MAEREPQQAAGGEDAAAAARAREEAQRRRRRAEIFGDVLPETTRDERDPDAAGERGTDAWLRAQVPPHHGSV